MMEYIRVILSTKEQCLKTMFLLWVTTEEIVKTVVRLGLYMKMTSLEKSVCASGH